MMYFPEPSQSRNPLYIFDLDGTLALIEHRRHLVEARETCTECKGTGFDPVTSDASNHPCVVCDGKQTVKRTPDWNAFFEACDKDLPNWPVIGTLMQLYSVGCDVRIWSGRSDAVKQKTLLWLHSATRIPLIKLELMLKMRAADDFTPDEQLKRKWLNTMGKQERARLAAVFDDRNKVVKMWRDAGVACFQVAPGEF
jgi:hypothetical protein